MYEFRWNVWNTDHIAEHGIGRHEAEYVVEQARRPYPRRSRDDTYLVRGQTPAGTYIQVVYTLDPDNTVYVLHARPLSRREKRRYRRGRR